jgi:hypothetical protein
MAVYPSTHWDLLCLFFPSPFFKKKGSKTRPTEQRQPFGREAEVNKAPLMVFCPHTNAIHGRPSSAPSHPPKSRANMTVLTSIPYAPR